MGECTSNFHQGKQVHLEFCWFYGLDGLGEQFTEGLPPSFISKTSFFMQEICLCPLMMCMTRRDRCDIHLVLPRAGELSRNKMAGEWFWNRDRFYWLPGIFLSEMKTLSMNVISV
jgi:hypothetical protein